MKDDVILIKFGSPAHAESASKERASAGSSFLLRVQTPQANQAIPLRVAVGPREDAAPAANQAGPDVLLYVDEPVIIHGVATQQIKSSLSITGWALAKEGVKAVSVELDGVLAGNAHYGMRRPDIAGAFPNHPGALLSGFGFSLARRALTQGRHVVSVKALSNNLKERKVEFAIDVAGGEEEEGPWSLRRRLGLAERRLAEWLIALLRDKAEFVVWLHCARAEAESIHATLRSLSHQIYTNWTVVLVGAPAVAEAELMAGELATIAGRLRRFAEDTPESGVPGESGDNVWVMPVAAGDVLSVDALMEFALLWNQEPGCDLLYADERRLNPASHRVEAFFKPQWSPDLLWSTNYIGRPWCARLQVLEQARRSAREFMDFGHYDLVLHCAAQARRVMHIPQVLCERRPDAAEPRKTEMQALRRAAKSGRLKVAVEPGRIDGTYRVFSKEAHKGLVSIIIPTCAARELIKTCIESLRRLTSHPDIEIICVDNILDEASQWKPWLRANADVVVEILDAFNWSQFNNIAAREASGEFLLFLNDDIEIIQPDWLQPLLDLAVRPEVGIVGPQLLYPDRRVQHAGMFLAAPGTARHAFRYCEENDPGYHGLALTQRNVIALTGACMLVRAEVFAQLGGFDEAHAVINNDVDFCLKAHDAGLRNVFTPFSQLIHHELGSRAQIKDDHDFSAFTARWDSLIASGDPFFHRHLSRSSDSYQYEAEP
ncbi:MAG: glycosyltransferase family 2 protein, partial [Steroidobacteraceae bacterium]